jgi:hypothetical protein
MTTPAPDVYVFISGNRELYGLSTRRDGGNLPCVADAGSWELRDVIPMMLASLAKYVRNADVAMTNLIMRSYHLTRVSELLPQSHRNSS